MWVHRNPVHYYCTVFSCDSPIQYELCGEKGSKMLINEWDLRLKLFWYAYMYSMCTCCIVMFNSSGKISLTTFGIKFSFYLLVLPHRCFEIATFSASWSYPRIVEFVCSISCILVELIRRARNLLDQLKVAVFQYSFWVTVIFIFVAGTATVSLFCMGYLVAFFYLMTYHQSLFVDKPSKLLRIWNIVLGKYDLSVDSAAHITCVEVRVPVALRQKKDLKLHSTACSMKSKCWGFKPLPAVLRSWNFWLLDKEFLVRNKWHTEIMPLYAPVLSRDIIVSLCVTGYNVAVIISKIWLQITSCVYIDVLVTRACWFVQLMNLVCSRPADYQGLTGLCASRYGVLS